MKLENICPICEVVKSGLLKYITDVKYIFTPLFIKNRYHLHLGYSFLLTLPSMYLLLTFLNLAGTPVWFHLFVGGFGAFGVNFLRELLYEDLYGAPFDWKDVHFGSYGGILGALLATFIF